MTRQDFELIASTIKHVGGIAQENYARAFVEMLRRTNPRFDEARFLKACGVTK